MNLVDKIDNLHVWKKIILCWVFLILFSIYFYNSNTTLSENLSIHGNLNQTISSNNSFKIQKSNRSPPLILFWTNFFTHNMTYVLPLGHPCPYNCKYSFDRSLNPAADARVFHVRNFKYEDLPLNNPNALNVYFTTESPVNSYFTARPKNNSFIQEYFNLTMTYRSNSDIYFPYGGFVELDGSEGEQDKWSEEQINQHIERKTTLGLSAISHCNTSSKREVYFKELANYINITKVGYCMSGLAPCREKCFDKLIGISFHKEVEIL